ncbi:MAG: zf-TFIIB domain-containing protein, partial [Desulfobacterales bacterium]|nr:zf-TFIIB domain-containing protein [Desulfobacterales bacterium]
MRCSKCKHYVELTVKSVKGTNIELDQCPDCKSLWFDRNELPAILKLPARELHFPDNAREGRDLCPRCKIPLHLLCYPQTTVIIDACRQCDGIWLDGNEIRELKTVRNSFEKIGSADAGKKDQMV